MTAPGEVLRPQFSVVVPAYNAQDTLGETLEAIAAQMYGDWECVVVDDGSRDGTLGIAKLFAERDPRFKVVAQENRGTGGAYNTGVRASVGDWVSICSADDLLLPEHLAVMARAIEAHPDCDIISSNGYYLRSEGSRDQVYSGESASHARSWSTEDLLKACFFGVGACYRRSLFDSVGGYRENVFGEDYDFWLRAMAAGAKHLYIPELLSVHRIAPTQKSADHVRSFESGIEAISRLLESGALSPRERRAARAALVARRQMIVAITNPRRLSGMVWRFTMRRLGKL